MARGSSSFSEGAAVPRGAPLGERTAHAAICSTPPSLPPLQPTRRWWAAAAHAGRVYGLCALAAAARDARVQVHRHAGGAAAHSNRGGAAHSNSQHSASRAASGHLAAKLREEAAALDTTRRSASLEACNARSPRSFPRPPPYVARRWSVASSLAASCGTGSSSSSTSTGCNAAGAMCTPKAANVSAHLRRRA